MKHSAIDFFAGSGLVSSGLSGYFNSVWANDICPKKAKFYTANHSVVDFHLGSIEDVSGVDLPEATLAWASFPCVDLSLAGNRAGLNAKRSGLFWAWLRVIDEMINRPSILVIENVEGLFSSAGGDDYRSLHNSLVERGYRVGPMIIDAKYWVPQSRVRAFVIAIERKMDASQYISSVDSWIHTRSVKEAVKGLDDVLLWALPPPPQISVSFMDIVDYQAQRDPEHKREKNISMIPERHRQMLDQYDFYAAPGYKRTRSGKQVLELRFDGLAGCLRVPRGGNSRQYLVIKEDKKLSTRLLTSLETTKLMGVPKGYKVPGSYNEIYAAMGDAVAYPVVKFLCNNLLKGLADLAAIQVKPTKKRKTFYMTEANL